MTDDTADFGYERVPAPQKAARVRAVFDSVAARYDLMNDLMSLGAHRLWKRFAAGLCGVRPGHRVLDLAGGTGDMTRLLAPRTTPAGRVVVADVNRAMLDLARARLADRGLVAGVDFAQVDAERLPFPERAFDCVVIAFGLRNVTDKAAALESMHRVLRPGGRAVVLEFSAVTVPAVRPLYDAYSFSVLPRLGRAVAGDAESYRYLAESIRMHPDQAALAATMSAAGLERVDVHNLAAGVVAVHRGFRL